MDKKFEHLNTVFTERLLAVAAELFQVVTDVISEYKEETDRTKQENVLLKKQLSAERLANEQDDSSQQAFPQELPDIFPGPLDSNSSVMQVKVELSTTKQDNGPPESMNDSSVVSEPHCVLGTIRNEEISSGGFHNYSDVKIKSEVLDTQIVTSDDSNTGMQREHVIDNNLVSSRGDQASDYSTRDSVYRDKTEKVFYCQNCGKAFKKHHRLKKHMTVHQKDRPRPYCCDLCGKSYSFACVLEVHRRIHTGERPHACKFCGRRFSQKGHLKEHERIHTGEKPYGCPVCGKRFIQNSHFKKHVRYHHPTLQRQSDEG